MAHDDSPVTATSRSGADVFDGGVRGVVAAFAFGRRAGAVFTTFFRTVFFVALAFVRFFTIDVS